MQGLKLITVKLRRSFKDYLPDHMEVGPGSECLWGKEELGRGQRGFRTQLLTAGHGVERPALNPFVCLSSHTSLSLSLLDLNVILCPQLRALGLGSNVGDPADVYDFGCSLPHPPP